jgi:hypothetical protein
LAFEFTLPGIRPALVVISSRLCLPAVSVRPIVHNGNLGNIVVLAAVLEQAERLGCMCNVPPPLRIAAPVVQQGKFHRGTLSGHIHSPLMPAALMIGHHFSISALCSAPTASGVGWSRGKISWPSSASRDRTVGSASASTVAALSFQTASFGVRLGTQSALQRETYHPGRPASSTVGMSGAASKPLPGRDRIGPSLPGAPRGRKTANQVGASKPQAPAHEPCS